ncbi:hypothetical protein [Devosia sp.]|uniref:hypothetical protein n=1 Tax=Devosia sp. TaxID=1871048 RepID=UPI002FC6FFBF
MTAKSAVFLAMRALLMQHWDPIGIRDVEQCYDEYDSYIPSILSLIDADIGIDELAQFLDKVVSERMGLYSNMAHSKSVAALLLRS